MIRYGIQIKTDGTDLRWISIGTGVTRDIQHAHLYTTKELAQAKIKSEIKAHEAWTRHSGRKLDYEVIEFTVEIK